MTKRDREADDDRLLCNLINHPFGSITIIRSSSTDRTPKILEDNSNLYLQTSSLHTTTQVIVTPSERYRLTLLDGLMLQPWLGKKTGVLPKRHRPFVNLSSIGLQWSLPKNWKPPVPMTPYHHHRSSLTFRRKFCQWQHLSQALSLRPSLGWLSVPLSNINMDTTSNSSSNKSQFVNLYLY